MIDEKKLISTMKCNGLCGNNPEECTAEAIEFVKMQPQVNQWIPTSDKNPEFNQNCLVTTDSGEIFTSKFFGYGEECQGFREYPDGVWEINQCELEVTAWQPLPEKYKEKLNEDCTDM